MSHQLRARPASRLRRVAAVSAVALFGATGLGTPAFAAAPANDEVAGAVALSIGDHITQDTTEATTTADDAALNANCGAPVTTASVWYSYTPAADGGVVLDMSASDYSGGFLVFEGTPTAESLITCGQFTVGFGAAAGTTYNIMVIDDDLDGNLANGGNLVLDVNEAPPPPTVAVTVYPKAKVTRDGTALIQGSYTCTDADFIELDGMLTQQVGRLKITGFGFVFDVGTCDGAAHVFTMPISGDNGVFSGGKAASITFTFACGAFECADGYVEQTVMLSKGAR
jgi:hypothetical protein